MNSRPSMWRAMLETQWKWTRGMLLLLAIAQTSLVFFGQQNRETTAQKVAGQLTTGSVQKAGLSQAQFTQLVCSKLPPFMDCSNQLVDYRAPEPSSVRGTGEHDADLVLGHRRTVPIVGRGHVAERHHVVEQFRGAIAARVQQRDASAQGVQASDRAQPT